MFASLGYMGADPIATTLESLTYYIQSPTSRQIRLGHYEQHVEERLELFFVESTTAPCASIP
jgi:hypothetical protein